MIVVFGTVAAYRLAKSPGPDADAVEAYAASQGALVIDILDAAAHGRIVRTSDVLSRDGAGIVHCTRLKVERRLYPATATGAVRTCDVAIFRCAFIVEAFALSGPSYTMTKRLGCR